MASPHDKSPMKPAPPPDASAVSPTKSTFDPASLGLETATVPGTGVDPRQGFTFLAPPQAGDELGRLGTYRVLDVLGKGGMGVVFRAEDPKLKRHVALKVMLPQYAAHPLAVQRFLREARNQAAVEHDHIIPIFQADEDAAGTPFIAMPLLKGQTLSAALVRDRRPPLAEVLRIGREVAEGLAAAHDQGLMHRDIKPANVWLEGTRRRVKILDFGLARAENEATVDADGTPLTASGAVVGTPHYMSPEQGRGDAVDHRTDLFALGVLLYQMTTGTLPFHGPNTMAILTALALNHPRPPADVAHDVPPALNALILALLEKHPADRPPTAQAVADELRRIEQGLSQTLVAIPLNSPAHDPWSEIDTTNPNTLVHVPTVSREPMTKTVRQIPWWAWVATGLAALVIVGFAVPQVIRVMTPRGTLVIEATDPNVEVLIKGKDGAEIRTKSRHVELRVGDYGIELTEKKDGFRLTTDKFSITQGGKTTVQVRLERPSLAVKPKPAAVPPKAVGPARFEEVHGVTRDALLAWAAKLPEGYRPLCYGSRAGDPVALFDAVAAPTPGDADRKFAVHPERDTSPVDELVKTHRPAATVYHRSGSTWAGLVLGVRDGGTWEFWFGDEVFIRGKIQAGLTNVRMQNDVRERLMPTSITAYSYEPDRVTYDMHLGWLPYRELEWHPDLTPDELTTKISEYKAKGWRPHLVSAHHNRAQVRFLAVFTDDPDDSVWDYTPNLTVAEYENQLATHRAKGQRPRCICSTDSGGTVRYTVVWDAVLTEPRFAADIARPHFAELMKAGALTEVHVFRGDQQVRIESADDLMADDRLSTLKILVTANNNPLTNPTMLAALRGLSAAWVGNPHLNLYGPVTDDQLRTITEMPSFRTIRGLGLFESAITDAGLAHVAGFPDVTFVQIHGCAMVTDAGLNRLSALPRLARLEVAALSTNGTKLAPHPTLTRVGLHYCLEVGDEAVARLAEFPKLLELSLLTPKVTSAGLAALRGRPLVTLGLNECPGIGDAAADSIAAIPNLTQLYLLRTKVTKSGVSKIAAALPRCRIEWDGGVVEPPTRQASTPTPTKTTPLEEVHGATVDELKAWAAKLPKGYRPTWVSTRGGGAGPRFDAMAAPAPDNRDWKLVFRPAADSKPFDDLRATHTIEHVAPHHHDGKYQNFTFGVEGGDSEEYWWGNPDFISDKIADGVTHERDNGSVKERWLPQALSAYQHPEGNTIYELFLTWQPTRDCEAHLEITPEELATKVAEYRTKGWRPHIINGHASRPDPRYVAVFTSNPAHESWDFTPNLSVAEYEKELTARGAKGQRPRCVCSHEANGNVTYTVVWDVVIEPAAVDRRVAEYVLSVGGELWLKDGDSPIRVAADLPRGPFDLTTIWLRENTQVTDAGLAVARGCTHLTHLDLVRTPITDAGLAHFADCKQLAVLDLVDAPIGDAGLVHFAGCADLRCLWLGGTKVTDAGLLPFKNCPALTHLDLRATRTTDAGLAQFAGCRNLIFVNLDLTRVTDTGLTQLRANPGLSHLYLDGTAITDTGAAALKGFPKLRMLTLRGTKVRRATVEGLALALPECKITWDGGVIEPAAKK